MSQSSSAATKGGGAASDEPVRLDFIDCLRGVAISGVVLVHTGQIIDGLPPRLASLARYGGMGVELFFLLSALTLATIYRHRPRDVTTFLIRRFFRIAPMFYLGAAFYLGLYGTGPRLPYSPEGIGPGTITLTLVFLHGWSPAAFNAVVPGGWSISDEAMFYLVFPLLLALVTDLRRAVVATLAAAVLSRIVFTQLPPLLQASAYAAYPLQTYAAFLFATQLPAFLCGFLAFFAIAALQARPEHPFNRKPIATAALLASGLLLIGAAASDNKTLTNYLLADALFVPLVVAAYASRSRLIVNRLLRHVGIVSYSVYIVHFALVAAAESLLLPALRGLAPPAQLAIVWVLVFVPAVAISSVTYRWIEMPAIRLGKKLAVGKVSPEKNYFN